MKFECDSCHAQYMIADEKVGKRGVKVKCKRCSHVIVVRPDKDEAKADTKADAADKKAEAPVESEELELPAPPPAAPIPDLEATGPARPAPVSMFANDTQLGGAAHDDDAPPSWEADKTQMGKVELPAETQADVASAPEAPAAAAAPAIKGESSIGDALDDQLAGAFNTMFDEGRPASDLASLADNPEEQRGPTKVLDLDAMNALRKATAETSQPGGRGGVDEQALASLRSDLGGNDFGGGNDAGGGAGWNEPRGDDAGDEAVWHAAIDDEDVGPLTLADLGRYIESGGIDRESLVWKTGMDNWLPAGEVKLVRDLFAKAPMPKLAPLPPEESRPVAKSNRSVGFGFDINAPEPPRGGSPFDAVPGMDESDPSWQPHGLTDVYQAANLAEAAGPAGGGLIGNAGMAARGGVGGAAEPEWRPSASSALASLVNDEIDRLSKGPTLPVDDGAPLPADDSSINSSLPFSSLAGADLDAGPSIADPNARPARTQNQMPAFDSSGGFPQQQGFGGPPAFQQFQPPAPPQQQRSPVMMYAGIGVVAVLLLLLTYKVMTPPQVVVVGPNGQPMQVGTGQVAMNTPPPVATQPTNTGPVTPPVATPTPPVAATPPVTPPVDAATTPPVTPPAETTPPVEPPKEEPKDTKKASTASKPAKPPKETPAPPKEEPKEEPKTKKPSNPDCDPVLDFDCKAKGGGEKVATKATLDKSDILAVVKGSLPKVKACGEKNGATGTIKMTWKIDKSGKPSDVSVADPKFGGTPVGTCVAGVVKAMRFPAYSGPPPSPVSIPLPLK